MIEVAKKLKDLKANRIFICAAFGLFCNGLEVFDKAYEEGLLRTGYLPTNLIYRTPELPQEGVVYGSGDVQVHRLYYRYAQS